MSCGVVVTLVEWNDVVVEPGITKMYIVRIGGV